MHFEGRAAEKGDILLFRRVTVGSERRVVRCGLVGISSRFDRLDDYPRLINLLVVFVEAGLLLRSRCVR